MTRWSVGTLVAMLLVGPWGGCNREPSTPPAVSPPAAPPAERADRLDELPAHLDGVILLDTARRRG